MTAPRLTDMQRALLAVLESEPNRGFDLDELARRLETSPQGACMTAASLCRRGLVDRFVGGVLRQRVHYQVAS